MIYTKKIITTSRTGRQYENTCNGCIHLENNEDITDLCYKYPTMENMVRCIDYEATKHLNSIQTVISHS